MRVVEFHAESTVRFMQHYGPERAGSSLPPEVESRFETFESWRFPVVYRIVFASAPKANDRPNVPERELHVFGHPSVNGFLRCIPSVAII